MAEITVKVGKEIDESKVDKSKLAKTIEPGQTPAAQAQGGEHYMVYVACSVCWKVALIEASTTHTVTWLCSNSNTYNVY